MSDLIALAFTAFLVQNIILNQFLGICSFLGVSNKRKSAIGMGFSIFFIITLSGTVTWLIYYKLLVPFELEFMRTIVFILVVAAMVQILEMAIKKFSPGLYASLGVYLPLITTNCAVLGLALLNIQYEYNLIQTIVHSIGAAVGFSLAIVLFAGLREKLEVADVPGPFQGFPVALVTASLMSIAFLGFAGLV